MHAIHRSIIFKLELRRVSALVYDIFREFLTVLITYQKEISKYWFSDPWRLRRQKLKNVEVIVTKWLPYKQWALTVGK